MLGDRSGILPALISMVVTQGRRQPSPVKPGASRHGIGPSKPMHSKHMDKDKAFAGTGGHLAYSGFTHIGQLENLKFAVGLREHADVEAVIAKLLPMAKTQDAVPKECMARSPGPVLPMEEEGEGAEECPKAECCAVRDKLDSLDHANDDLKKEVTLLENSIKSSMNMMSSLDRQHKLAEGNKAQLNTQLQEAVSRTATLEVDVSDLQGVNTLLREKCRGLESRVLCVRKEVESKAAQRDALQHALHDQVMFGSPYQHQDGYSWEEEMSVRSLDDYKGQPPLSPNDNNDNERLHTGAPTIRRDFAHKGRVKKTT